ncbi:SLC4A7 [Symbiodinium natans]|uniref:SLC4A7 protein n=1 Tax=Symbiodinium natans TaxID=878477 RepID=A0A812RZW0_9DINO|nr:SLC4A7 [Symbiodinium natans]
MAISNFALGFLGIYGATGHEENGARYPRTVMRSELQAIGFAVLGYLDQNLTSVIVNRPSNNLQKGPGYHLVLFVRGALMLPVWVVLGLPFSVAATVPSTLPGALKFLPRAVLQGVFFYMGVASLTGSNLFDRLFLWLI